MKTTKNKAFGKNKFYNFYINKKENEYFFIFPVVGFSNSKNISWDIKMSSFFIAWGRSFIQLNLLQYQQLEFMEEIIIDIIITNIIVAKIKRKLYDNEYID